MTQFSGDSINFIEGDVILVNKPYTITSFGVVAKLKYLLKPFYNLHREKLIQSGIKIENILKLKIGHAGTLDPLATGLLVICVGKMTKKIQSIQEMEKVYSGIIVLGATTPSFDLEKEPDTFYSTEHITNELIYTMAKSFEGTIQQTPPIFSAVKVKGDRSYELARKGELPELQPKLIQIKKFDIIKIDGNEIHFNLICSKGTYVRSLARDFGIALNSGAYLRKLCRERIGEYDLKNAIEIEFSPKDKQSVGVKFYEDKK